MRDQLFLESDWDTCVILDACRYDVFEDVYDEYLEGTLEKRRSPGSATPEWAYKTFTGVHDIAYFSGNPFINSSEIPLTDFKWGASCNYDWIATDHISEVIDVWRHGWDDECGTVPPENIATSYRKHASATERHDRTVLHYMQPHAPFLTQETEGKLSRIKQGIARQNDRANTTLSPLSTIGDTVRPYVEHVLGQSTLAMKAGIWMELGLADIWGDNTREATLAYHEENLRIVLESVAELLPELDGEVVVTADHGEAFGEHGVWEHHIETHIPPLVEIPWLKIQ